MKFSSRGEEAASRAGSKRIRRRTRFDALEHDVVMKFWVSY